MDKLLRRFLRLLGLAEVVGGGGGGGELRVVCSEVNVVGSRVREEASMRSVEL